MKYLTVALFAILITCSIQGAAFSQTTKKQKNAAKTAAIKGMIDSVKYVFEANYAYPLRGTQKNLTSNYDVHVSKDTIVAYLPYYGRAYTAPQDPTEGGIKFTSTNFSYTKEQRKNGSWRIIIKPKDGNGTDWRDARQLMFDITPDGYASLQVISTNRDPISFNGTIERK